MSRKILEHTEEMTISSTAIRFCIRELRFTVESYVDPQSHNRNDMARANAFTEILREVSGSPSDLVEIAQELYKIIDLVNEVTMTVMYNLLQSTIKSITRKMVTIQHESSGPTREERQNSHLTLEMMEAA